MSGSLLLAAILDMDIFHNCCSWAQGCVMISIIKIKVTIHTAILNQDNVSKNVCHSSMIQACILTLNQGHVSKVDATVHTQPNFVSRPYFFDNLKQLLFRPKCASCPLIKIICHTDHQAKIRVRAITHYCQHTSKSVYAGILISSNIYGCF